MPSNNDYQQNIVLRRTPPSAQSLSEGQIVFALAPNRGMYMYTKRNGQVWIAPFQKQQDKQILNDLEVKNNVKFLKDLTIYGDLNLKVIVSACALCIIPKVKSIMPHKILTAYKLALFFSFCIILFFKFHTNATCVIIC